jgi:hypothetical protein
VNLGDGVAVRVSALCLTPNGRLSGSLLASDAVRGALLLDVGLSDVAEADVASGRWIRRRELLGLRPPYTNVHRDQRPKQAPWVPGGAGPS